MSKKYNKYVNIVRSEKDEWCGVTLEEIKINIPIKSIENKRSVDKLDILNSNIQYTNEGNALINIELDDFPCAYNIQDITRITSDFDYLIEALKRVDLEEFDLNYYFYLDHSYYWLVKDRKEKGIEISDYEEEYM